MDENRRPTGTPGSDQESRVPASPAAPPPTAKKVGFRDIFGDLLTPVNLTVAGVAALLGLIGLFGGWDRVAAKQTEIPVMQAEQEVMTEPLKLEFKKAFWFQDVPQLSSVSAGNRGVMVTVDATNTSSQPLSAVDVQQAFQLNLPGVTSLTGPDGEGVAPRLMRGSDLLAVKTLQPGLKTRLALMWEQADTQPAPLNLTVNLFSQTYRKSALDGSMRYLDATQTAQVTLPVTEFKLP